MVPNHVRYQAALRPEGMEKLINRKSKMQNWKTVGLQGLFKRHLLH
jgi:hypothetical protein